VTETPVWPEDPGWRVRSGAGLVSQMAGQGLFSAEEEEERQRRAAEREAEADAGAQQLRDEQAAEAAAERAFEMARQGYTPRTPGEFLAAIAAEDARREAVRQRRIEKGLPVADDGYQPDPVSSRSVRVVRRSGRLRPGWRRRKRNVRRRPQPRLTCGASRAR
jgi:hypothetical protein